MLNTDHQNLGNRNKFQSFSVCLRKGANLVAIVYVLEVIINMQKETQGVKKSTKCIIANMEDMETSIYKKIDQSMAWMKEHFTKVIKSTYFNPDVPVTGEFCIFGFCFNLNLVINVASSPESG